MKGKFIHISRVVRESRYKTPYSQQDLSSKLGYRSLSGGQFISNVERGLCGLPPKKMVETAQILNVDIQVLKEASIRDYQESLELELQKALSKEGIPC